MVQQATLTAPADWEASLPPKGLSSVPEPRIGKNPYIGAFPYIRTVLMPEPPFIVGRPVTGEYFVDREEEMRRLLALVTGVQKGASSNSALIGLRRTGKTSILENLAIELEPNRAIVPATVNCYGIAARSRFAKLLVERTAEAYAQKTGDRGYLKRLARAAGQTAKAALEMVSEVKFADFSVKLRDINADEDSLIEGAMQYVDALAKEKDVFFVVMLDEFQDAIRWGDNTLKRIRTVVQSQKRVCYVLAGSATTLMRDLVYDRRSPFYRQLVEIPVRKLDKDTVVSFLKRRFSKAQMNCRESDIERIANYSDGYPDYVQRIGLELYLSVGQEGTVTEERVDKAYEDMVLGLDGEFENYLAAFSPLEREILAALALGRVQPSEVAREVRRPIFNISKTLATLVNYGIIERPAKGRYRISDPVFSDWLGRRFKGST